MITHWSDPERERRERRNLYAALILCGIFLAVALLLRYCGHVPRVVVPRADTVIVVRYDTVWREVVLKGPKVIEYRQGHRNNVGQHISYSDSIRYVQRCDTLSERLGICEEAMSSQSVYGDTVKGDTVSVWYRATVTGNELSAIGMGYRLEQPVTIERTVTQYEEVRVPVRSLWLDGGLGYQQSYTGLPVGPVGQVGLSYRSASGVAIGADVGLSFGGWSVGIRGGYRLVKGR